MWESGRGRHSEEMKQQPGAAVLSILSSPPGLHFILMSCLLPPPREGLISGPRGVGALWALLYFGTITNILSTGRGFRNTTPRMLCKWRPAQHSPFRGQLTEARLLGDPGMTLFSTLTTGKADDVPSPGSPSP